MKTAPGLKLTPERLRNLKVLKPTGLFASSFDLQILRAVFKWKVLPRFLIKSMFRKGENEKTFEKKLERLVTKGLIQRVDHIGKIRFYQMTEQGFLRFRQGLDGFQEEGFASENIWHDFLTMALQFGLWSAAKPNEVEIVTEQEMRRFYRAELPYWLPSIELHRPDGFTKFQCSKGKSILSFEVEISRKANDRYDPVCQYYQKNTDIDFVIWLMRDTALMKLVKERILLSGDDLDRHGFILLDDFKTNFWNAQVLMHQKESKKFVTLMSDYVRLPVETTSEICRQNVSLTFLKALSSN